MSWVFFRSLVLHPPGDRTASTQENVGVSAARIDACVHRIESVEYCLLGKQTRT